jgi:hypothetical protein
MKNEIWDLGISIGNFFSINILEQQQTEEQQQ